MPKHSPEKKMRHILKLMEKLILGQELYCQDTLLQEELEVSERTLRRYLDEDLFIQYQDVLVTERKQMKREGRQVMVYRLAENANDKRHIILRMIEANDNLNYLLQIVRENDPQLLQLNNKDLREDFEAAIRRDADVFLFVSAPFEELGDHLTNERFRTVRHCVKMRRYADIGYRYDKDELLLHVKCLKLIYMSNNWYLAIEDDNEQFRFLRFMFITSVTIHTKGSFRLSVLDRYRAFFATVQNPMTLKAPAKEAIIRSTPKVALYFKDGMKRFFRSQRYIQTLEDGSVEFALSYTQSIEILPFIKQWMPDLQIVSPLELREEMVADCKVMIERLGQMIPSYKQTH